MSRAAAYLLGVMSGASAALAVGALLAVAGASDSDEADAALQPAAPRREAPAGAGRGTLRKRSASDSFASVDAGSIRPPPRADGTVTGRVLDWQGRPMAGVAVRASPCAPPVAVGERPTSDPEERLRRQLRDVVRADRYRREWGRSCATDGAGAFTIAGLGEQYLEVEAQHDGWEFTTGDQSETFARARSGEWVSFTGHRRHDVDIAVVLPDGTPPAAARITVETRRRSVTTEWKPGETSVSLRAGRHRLSAASGADDELTSDEFDVEMPEEGEPPAIQLRLEERSGVIVGLGAGGPDAPCAAEVKLVPEEGEAETRMTAPGGVARFGWIAPGRWTLVVSNGIGVEFHRETLDVGTGLVRRDVALPARDLRDWKLVRVLDPSGRPIDDAGFGSGYVCGDRSDSGRVAAVRLDDGVWRVPLYPASQSDTRQAIRRWISVDAGSLGAAWADVDATSASDVALRLVAHASLVVRVEGAGEGYSGLEVVAQNAVPGPAPGELGQFQRSENVTAGEVELRRMPPGQARVSLRAAGETVAETLLTLASGENRVSFAAPAIQNLRVTMPDGAETMRIWLRRVGADGELKWLKPDETDGDVAMWRHLLPGAYRVWCREGDMPLTLPCATEVRMVPRPFTAIRFAPKGDSPMYAAGLRSGDLCVQLDGAEFTGSKQIDAVLAAACLKNRSTLAIIRGGRQFDIDLDLSQVTLRWDYMSR